MAYRSKEQQLIDICFQLVLSAHYSKEWWDKADRHEKIEWVAHQLRECGFDTHPIGSCLGSLMTPELREKIPLDKEIYKTC